MIRLKDVADKAGVSLTTVSRVLSNDETLSVSDETRNNVIQTAKELNYKPRRTAPKSNDTIGVFLLYDAKEEIDDPYYLTIRISVKNELLKNNFSAKEFYEDFHQHKHNLKDLSGCIIIGSSAMWNDSYSKILKDWNKPCVFVDFKPDAFEFNYIVSDFEYAMNDCLNFLYEKEYRKIGYIGTLYNYLNNNSFKQDCRETTYRNFLMKKNLLVEDYIHLVEKTSIMTNVEVGYNSIYKAYNNNMLPEVFFAENDSIAMGALNALNKLNIKVPEKIGVFGCNDIPTASFMNPPLTTIKIYNNELGISAVGILLKELQGSKLPSYGILLSSNLVIRKSTK